MKRFVAIFTVLVALLSGGLYLGLRQQGLEAERPSGGSATIEGVEVGVVARLGARITAIEVQEGDRVEAGQVLVQLDCTEPMAMHAEATAAVNAATIAIEMAEGGVELADIGVGTATKQTEAVGAQANATRAQRGALKVQRRAAARELERLTRLLESGAGTQQAVDQAQSAVDALVSQESAIGSQVHAVTAQKKVAAQQTLGTSVQVRVAQSRVDAAGQDLARAQAVLARADAAVGECTLRAPRAGVVQTRAYEPGEVVMPGSRVLSIVDISEVHATFYLPNAELAAAEPQVAVEVVADAYPDEVFEGRVLHVGVEAEFTPRNVQTRDDRDRLVYAVEVSVPNADGRLRPGMAVEVSIPGTGQ